MVSTGGNYDCTEHHGEEMGVDNGDRSMDIDPLTPRTMLGRRADKRRKRHRGARSSTAFHRLAPHRGCNLSRHFADAAAAKGKPCSRNRPRPRRRCSLRKRTGACGTRNPSQVANDTWGAMPETAATAANAALDARQAAIATEQKKPNKNAERMDEAQLLAHAPRCTRGRLLGEDGPLMVKQGDTMEFRITSELRVGLNQLYTEIDAANMRREEALAKEREAREPQVATLERGLSDMESRLVEEMRSLRCRLGDTNRKMQTTQEQVQAAASAAAAARPQQHQGSSSASSASVSYQKELHATQLILGGIPPDWTAEQASESLGPILNKLPEPLGSRRGSAWKPKKWDCPIAKVDFGSERECASAKFALEIELRRAPLKILGKKSRSPSSATRKSHDAQESSRRPGRRCGSR